MSDRACVYDRAAKALDDRRWRVANRPRTASAAFGVKAPLSSARAAASRQ
ncbi:MAG: hypothetical protein OXH53_10455 [bacterium]|nr:hypothetical protein [bacterium]